MEIRNLIGTEQLKIVRERRKYVRNEIYRWGNQQKFDILNIEKIGEWSSPNINIVAYSREMLYRYIQDKEFYFGKGRRS